MTSISPDMIFMAAVVFMALTLGVIAMVMRTSLQRSSVMTRRLAGAPEARTMTDKKPSKNMVALFGQHLTLPDEKEISRIRFQLAQAGYYSVKAIPVFYAIRLFSLLAPQFILLSSWGLWGGDIPAQKIVYGSCALIIAGLFGPGLFLRSKINKRRQSAREGFPDMIDLLISCIEAGLGLDAALMTIAKELGGRFPVLKVNLDLLNLELMAGRSRHEAFKNFGERLGLEEAKALTVMLKQSEEMGSSLGFALRTFSEEMRTKRMLLAEEKALALSAKLTIPLIVFIFPTIMVMLLLPAAVRLQGAF